LGKKKTAESMDGRIVRLESDEVKKINTAGRQIPSSTPSLTSALAGKVGKRRRRRSSTEF
jgi:hypothetical protein